MQDFDMLLELVIVWKRFATSVTPDFNNAHVIVSFVMEHQRFLSEIFITKVARVSDSRAMDKLLKRQRKINFTKYFSINSLKLTW